MGVTVTTRGALPGRVWDVQASRELALAVRAVIVTRTFRHGRGVTDAPHKPYSTKAMTVTAGSETDRRLKAKGGLPAYGRGHPRRLLTASGRSRKAHGWTITGRYYERGYAQYKAESRKGRGAPNASGLPKSATSPSGGSAPVDLTLSGQLQREFVVKDVTLTKVTIGLTGEATGYGSHVHAARPWIGLSPSDQKTIAEALNEGGIVGPTGARRGIIGRALDRAEKAAAAKRGAR